MEYSRKIDARGCSVRELSSEDDKSLLEVFLKTNHSQGGIHGLKVAFGLFHREELVQILAFGVPRFNRSFQWEILSECSKGAVRIPGGTAKLFTAFRELYRPLSVIVYPSPRHRPFNELPTHYERRMNFEPYEPAEGKTTEARANAYISTESLSPVSDAVGYLYRVDCSCGALYLGMSERLEERSIHNYIGSGTLWTIHLKEFPEHFQIKSILHWSFDPDDLRAQEEKLIGIGKRIYGRRLCNTKLSRQGVKCSQCRQFGRHRKNCSNFVKPGSRTKNCSLCSGRSGHHRKKCTLYKTSIPKPCGECSVTRGHSRECSKKVICEECGSGNTGAHKKDCSLYLTNAPCGECNSMKRHRVRCSQFRAPKACGECDSRSHHKTSCSSYRIPKTCKECGRGYGNHRKDCTKNSRGVCELCKSPSAHKKSCSRYRRPAGCEECGAVGVHFKVCSNYRASPTCEECGGLGGKHRKVCSLHWSAKSKLTISAFKEKS